MRSIALSLALIVAAIAPRPAHALVVLGWHDVKDRIADDDSDIQAISTRNFAMQLDWLRAHGYVPVSAQAVRDAQAGRATLPPKAVLLTFDGGWRSVYTHALPLLRAYGWPALVAVPTARVDRPAGGSVRVGLRDVPRDAFLSWRDVKALQASGLVEVASEGDDLVTPLVGDPQGDLLPAASARAYRGAYETDTAYRERLRRDLAASIERLMRATGARPQALVWPDRMGSPQTRALAQSLGLNLVLDAEARTGTADLGLAARDTLDADAAKPVRLVMVDNPGAGDLAYELRRDPRRDGMRAVRVLLDDVVGADAAATSRNVDTLVERIRSIRPTHVVLSALSDRDGDGHADAAWYPSTTAPVRDDLLTHVAARLITRAGVDVLAWLPAGTPQATVTEVLALTPVQGVVTRDVLPRSATGDRIVVREIDAAGDVVPPPGDADFVALRIPASATARSGAIDRAVAAAASSAAGLARTVFIVDGADALASSELEARVRRIVASGGRHAAYVDDDATRDRPPLEPARAAISARAFPYLER